MSELGVVTSRLHDRQSVLRQHAARATGMLGDLLGRWLKVCCEDAQTQASELAGERLIDVSRMSRQRSAGNAKSQPQGSGPTCASVCTSRPLRLIPACAA